MGPTGQRGTDDARGRGALAGGPGDATRDEAVRAGAHAGLRRASRAERGEGAGLRGREGARGEWAERRVRTGPARVREVGEGRTGPVGFLGRVRKKGKGGCGLGCQLGLGWLGWVSPFLFPFSSLQLTQTNSNSNSNLNSTLTLKQIKQCASMNATSRLNLKNLITCETKLG